MNTKEQEALTLALEALEENHHLIEEHERPEYLAQYDRVISLVAKALADHCEDNLNMVEQQEGQSNYCLQCESLGRELAELKAQQSTEQVESVGYYDAENKELRREIPMGEEGDWWQAVYTHPPVPMSQPVDKQSLTTCTKALNLAREAIEFISDGLSPTSMGALDAAKAITAIDEALAQQRNKGYPDLSVFRD